VTFRDFAPLWVPFGYDPRAAGRGATAHRADRKPLSAVNDLHFEELDEDSSATACGLPLCEAGRVECRRVPFLRAERRCPTCLAIARARDGIHFGWIDADPPGTACGLPLLKAERIEFRRGSFLRGEQRCPTCLAIAQMHCPEVLA
jgi:hypothetical protein